MRAGVVSEGSQRGIEGVCLCVCVHGRECVFIKYAFCFIYIFILLFYRFFTRSRNTKYLEWLGAIVAAVTNSHTAACCPTN